MIDALLDNRWLSIGCRLLLGGLFIVAALPKIADPPSFAQAVYNYGILPPAAVNAAALVVPWTELVAGVALVAGVWRRGAALLVSALLVVFIAALAWNLARGVPVDCGCFSLPDAAPRGREAQLAAMRWDIVRDLAVLLVAVQVLWARVTWKPAVRPEEA